MFPRPKFVESAGIGTLGGISVCLIGCLWCSLQSCSCRPQQISAQMDLIGTRCRGLDEIRSASSGVVVWWVQVRSFCARRWRSSQPCRLAFEAPAVSSPSALLQANRRNASIAWGKLGPSNNEALPPQPPPTSPNHNPANQVRSASLGLVPHHRHTRQTLMI